MNLNSPTVARLTPPSRPLPAGMTVTRADIAPGLPYQLDISPGGLRVILTLSTGLVRPLVQSDPTDVVMSSALESDPRGPVTTLTDMLADCRAEASPRLLFASGLTLVGQCPLTVGRDVLIPSAAGADSAGTQLRVMGFSINASALVGTSAVGSWIELAWRDVLPGSDAFDSLVLRPELRGKVFYTRTQGEDIEEVRIEDGTLSSAADSPNHGLSWELTHG